MSVHWPSFLLGLATIPLLFLVAALVTQMVGRLRSTPGLRPPAHSGKGPAGLEPLRFTPRLMGRLREPLATEDQAQAS